MMRHILKSVTTALFTIVSFYISFAQKAELVKVVQSRYEKKVDIFIGGDRKSVV